MSSPSSATHYHRRYSWTPSISGSQAQDESDSSGLFQSIQHSRHDSTSHLVQSSNRDDRESKRYSQHSLKSFLSKLNPFSNKPNKEFVVTRRNRLQKPANMEGDMDDKSAPSSRTLTPGPLEGLDGTKSNSEGILQPIISTEVPGSSLETDHTAIKERPGTPPPSSKSVTFASPVRSYSPRRYYEEVDDEDSHMANTCLAETQRRPIGNPYSIDSEFNLNTRRRSTDRPVEKLKKRASVFSLRRRSSQPAKLASAVTNTAPDAANLSPLVPERSISSSSAKSLSSRLSFLRFPSKGKRLSNPSTTTPTSPSTPSSFPSFPSLPTDRVALEGRINYHISRLDRLKQRLALLNEAISSENAEYNVLIVSLRRQKMEAAIEDLGFQIQWLRDCRNGLRPSVAFHRDELARIGRKRMEMDAAEGYEPRLPAVYDNLDKDEVWEGRFAA